MSFQLIYVDDYGNTGLKLDDPAQPLFMLFGLVVPDDRWHTVETELWTINKTVAQTIGIELFNFELHAWQFFSNRNKTFRDLSLDERAEIVRRIATILRDHGGHYIAVYVKKADLKEGLEGTSRVINTMLDHPEARQRLPVVQLGADVEVYRSYMGKLLPHLFSPYVVSLATLIVEIDELLSSQNQRGVLILDRQDEYQAAHTIKAFTLLRELPDEGRLRGLLEQPLQGDGRSNILLQAADLIGYLVGAKLKERLYGKSFPTRHEATFQLVEPTLFLKDALERIEDHRCKLISREFALRLVGLKAPPELAEVSLSWYLSTTKKKG